DLQHEQRAGQHQDIDEGGQNAHGRESALACRQADRDRRALGLRRIRIRRTHGSFPPERPGGNCPALLRSARPGGFSASRPCFSPYRNCRVNIIHQPAPFTSGSGCAVRLFCRTRSRPDQPQWKRKSSAPRLANVKLVRTMLFPASTSIWTSAPTWWLAACTAAKLAKTEAEKSSVSWSVPVSPNVVMVSWPKPALNTKLSAPAPPFMMSLPAPPMMTSLPAPARMASLPAPASSTLAAALPVS